MGLTPSGVTINPKRLGDGDFGEAGAEVALAAIPNALIALNAPQPDTTNSPHGYMQDGSLFVPRGSDLQSGDRFKYQDKTFGVVGEAQWDMNHPFTGYDFGYVEYTIRVGG